MAIEHKPDGKTGCTACPYCGADIDHGESLAKHLRHDDCDGGDG